MCSVTCGIGEQYRTRVCDSPLPSGGGMFCLGNDRDTTMCSHIPCDGSGKVNFKKAVRLTLYAFKSKISLIGSNNVGFFRLFFQKSNLKTKLKRFHSMSVEFHP